VKLYTFHRPQIQILNREEVAAGLLSSYELLVEMMEILVYVG